MCFVRKTILCVVLGSGQWQSLVGNKEGGESDRCIKQTYYEDINNREEKLEYGDKDSLKGVKL